MNLVLISPLIDIGLFILFAGAGIFFIGWTIVSVLYFIKYIREYN